MGATSGRPRSDLESIPKRDAETTSCGDWERRGVRRTRGRGAEHGDYSPYSRQGRGRARHDSGRVTPTPKRPQTNTLRRIRTGHATEVHLSHAGSHQRDRPHGAHACRRSPRPWTPKGRCSLRGGTATPLQWDPGDRKDGRLRSSSTRGGRSASRDGHGTRDSQRRPSALEQSHTPKPQHGYTSHAPTCAPHCTQG